ncbi:putative Serine/threonine-protein kinase BUR1 [Glarea lozoyensis 74030]|uniref:cyclin-dependent kinase n=1 Tax=Glarea lozoyensis (strain ATCC 74030 / MF5533) TaxID=1104152 RepID=H0EIH4_GLAL7|nr:putative Serine/threonine-protein kinase BUR1 [Glarea lozoyensis 74030]
MSVEPQITKDKKKRAIMYMVTPYMDHDLSGLLENPEVPKFTEPQIKYLWGVGCVFGEMLVGKPILAGDSDQNQLKIIFDLVGSPTEDTMPRWRSLPNAEGLNVPPRAPTLFQRFREYGSSACNLLQVLLTLDYQTRWNALDALQHEYFRTEPLPAKPGDIPIFESSHELDRRKVRGQKAGLPPAPKGGTVGMGPTGGWGGANGNQEITIARHQLGDIEMASIHPRKVNVDPHGDEETIAQIHEACPHGLHPWTTSMVAVPTVQMVIDPDLEK